MTGVMTHRRFEGWQLKGRPRKTMEWAEQILYDERWFL